MMTLEFSLEHLKKRKRKDYSTEYDKRSPHQIDRARIIHSASFRRLQAKTQVLGVGEGDFHRTRLTHSIECAQIGYSLFSELDKSTTDMNGLDRDWLPSRDLIEATCLAHDIGHPPFGHAGEKVLFKNMLGRGGFEGNAQTLRILTKLEKYTDGQGINPTRRLILAVLKYPISYNKFQDLGSDSKPPKCYYEEEKDVIDWALSLLSESDCNEFQQKGLDGKAKYKTLDCSIMNLADDIAYAVHDLEDIIARKMLSESKFKELLNPALKKACPDRASKIIKHLLNKQSFLRKREIGRLVGFFVNEILIEELPEFTHPLLKYNAVLSENANCLMKELKKITLDHVAKKPAIQQLEQRGQYMVSKVFKKFIDDPEHLIPEWEKLNTDENRCRNVCDYIAGMTDDYLVKVYKRLFIPDHGSSMDEL